MLRAFFPSLIFCLRKLPLHQALKLPIILYKAHLSGHGGRICINGEVRFGLIRLGQRYVGLSPNNGIMLENSGMIIFNGPAAIGNDSAVVVGPSGTLEFGPNFSASASFSLACYHPVRFAENVLVGWDNRIIDTDFHRLKSIYTNEKHGTGYGSISVGHNVWIANGCRIYKNVPIPHSCVVGAGTVIHKGVDCQPYSLITNHSEICVKATGLYHDRTDDSIQYS